VRDPFRARLDGPRRACDATLLPGSASLTFVVAAHDLSKRYGSRLAVDRVSFEVAPNEVLGLLGPNGSGKSTILRMLTGYLRPSAGTAQVGGFDIVDEGLEARRLLAYVPEDVPLYSHMRVREFLEFMGRLRDPLQRKLAVAVDRVVERLALGAVRELPIWKLSRGYRQRVAIAQGLLGNPKLLILDEPTNGLDPRQIIEVRGLIRALAQDLSVIVTSHILSEVERVSHRAVILLEGRVLHVHDLSRPDTNVRSRTVVRGRDPDAIRRALADDISVSAIGVGPEPELVTVENSGPPGSVVRALVNAGAEIVRVESAQEGLEGIFLRLTAGASA